LVFYTIDSGLNLISGNKLFNLFYYLSYLAFGGLNKLCENADNKTKQEIIGSIYPEKVTFDGFRYRTARLNEVLELIYNMDKGFSQNKSGQTESNFALSTPVTRPGFEPRQAESESAVLPLYYRAGRLKCKSKEIETIVFQKLPF
jgi:hypothetical protein